MLLLMVYLGVVSGMFGFFVDFVCYVFGVGVVERGASEGERGGEESLEGKVCYRVGERCLSDFDELCVNVWWR